MKMEQLTKGTEIKSKIDAIENELKNFNRTYGNQRITIELTDPGIFFAVSDSEIIREVLGIVILNKYEELSRLRKEFEEL